VCEWDSFVVGSVCFEVDKECSHLEDVLVFAGEGVEFVHHERLFVGVYR